MGPFGIQELLVILVIAVFLFGSKKLPDLAKGIGEGIKNFKKAIKTEDEPAPEEKKKEA